MAVLGLRLTADGAYLADSAGASALYQLDEALAKTPASAPVVILVHGFRFDYSRPITDPNRMIYALEPQVSGRKVASWPKGLGFQGSDPDEGLCIGFAWAAMPKRRVLRATGFPQAYEQAENVGASLGQLLDHIDRQHAHRRVDIFAHSLGVRVALQAVKYTTARPGRVILLGAAEYTHTALEAVAAASPEIAYYNFTSRENDFYDFLFETFAPSPSLPARALGTGLANPPRNWIDLQLDDPAIDPLLKRRNITVSGRPARASHWGFYTRDGVMAIYRDILRTRHNWTIPQLRLEFGQAAQPPRRSRIFPRWPGFGASAGIREA